MELSFTGVTLSWSEFLQGGGAEHRLGNYELVASEEWISVMAEWHMERQLVRMLS